MVEIVLYLLASHLDALAEQTQCTIVGQAAVLAEGNAAERKDIIYLEPLPLFLH